MPRREEMIEHLLGDETVRLRGSVGRTLNFIHRTRMGLVRKPIEEMGGLDLIYEAVREDNPRGFNRKVMKDMRKKYSKMRKVERRLKRMHERIQGVRNV